MASQALFNHGVGFLRDGWSRTRELVAKQAKASNTGVVAVCSVAAAGILAAALSFCFLLLFLATCAIVPLVLATACLAGLACLWSSLLCCWAAFCAACFGCWLGVGLLAVRAAYWLMHTLGIYPRPIANPNPATPHPASPHLVDPSKLTPNPPSSAPNAANIPLPHAGTKHPRPADPNATPTADRTQPRTPLPAFPRTTAPARTHPTAKRRKARPSKRTYPELLHIYTFSLDSTPEPDSEAGPQPPNAKRPPAGLTDALSPAATWGSLDTASADNNATARAGGAAASGAATAGPQAQLTRPSLQPTAEAAAALPVPSPTPAAAKHSSDSSPAAPTASSPPQLVATPPPAAAAAAAAGSPPPAAAAFSAATAATGGGAGAGATPAVEGGAVEPAFDDISLPLAPKLPTAWLRALPARLPPLATGGCDGGDVQLALLPHTAAFAGMRQKQE